MSKKVNFEKLCKGMMATSDQPYTNPEDESDFYDFQMELLDGYARGVPNYRHITQKGSGEWEYECFTVFEWEGQMYRYDYKYLSHNGYELDCIHAHKVSKVTKEVTVYE